MSEALFFVTNIVVSVVIFLVTVGSGGTLSLVNVYTTLALVNTAQFGELRCLFRRLMFSVKTRRD